MSVSEGNNFFQMAFQKPVGNFNDFSLSYFLGRINPDRFIGITGLSVEQQAIQNQK